MCVCVGLCTHRKQCGLQALRAIPPLCVRVRSDSMCERKRGNVRAGEYAAFCECVCACVGVCQDEGANRSFLNEGGEREIAEN